MPSTSSTSTPKPKNRPSPHENQKPIPAQHADQQPHSETTPQPARSRWKRLSVHRLGAFGDHRLELVPVDLLGHRGSGVATEIGDRLDGHVVVTHDRHERMPQLTRRPVLPYLR